MTKRKFAGYDYATRPLDAWNVNHFLAWLSDETKRRFGVDYMPMGRGSISEKFNAERGMLKQAQERYGNAVLKRFIERCLDAYRPTAQYPSISFGFMWSYRRDELPRAQADVARAVARTAKVQRVANDEFDEYL